MRLALVISLALAPLPLWAGEITVAPGGLTAALAEAQDGDVLRLEPGAYAGPIVLDRSLTLDGGGAAHIDGGGNGSVITVTAEDVTVQGLTITGSGDDHETIDSGVQLTKTAHGAVVRDNILRGNLYGIDIHGARNSTVENNIIEGQQHDKMNRRGNGVYVWNAPGAVVTGNDIRWGRDGIFVNSSKKNSFTRNRFRDLRFGVHYMYANQSEVSDNISIGNHLGYAVMYSTRVTVTGNLSVDDRDHGVMLNYTNDSVITGNLVRGGGTEKCAFLYNSHKNRFENNRFEACEIGIHFTAGSDRNRIVGNAFIGNQTQVKYVSTKWDEWSEDGRGNYWSDFVAYDLNGDGLADTPYRPNDAMDHVLWTQPSAKLLLGSPAVQLVRWSQSAFPALLPGGVVDSHALMRPIEITPPQDFTEEGS
ncbi:nitrous oxide reductase family maturation protein NosD [Roseovarius faecimaris]|uniref:Nitrous oxide reductase family maturation protein NosD n=1 Tax=Roseovarius faecimaris TaxID=2494550 RepID=A0A6I6IS88_9RHOB|nr:nitrous oxide reductase family maturation protein NosD [Roseovarius faecimaris]QGX98377.1 nitrous oxide reductase family maturation protein NosD [Roseovarius faecimaris]